MPEKKQAPGGHILLIPDKISIRQTLREKLFDEKRNDYKIEIADQYMSNLVRCNLEARSKIDGAEQWQSK